MKRGFVRLCKRIYYDRIYKRVYVRLCKRIYYDRIYKRVYVRLCKRIYVIEGIFSFSSQLLHMFLW